MKFYLNEREVAIIDRSIDEDFIQVIEAYYLDTEEKLNEEELLELESKYQQRLCECHYGDLADYVHDMMSDR